MTSCAKLLDKKIDVKNLEDIIEYRKDKIVLYSKYVSIREIKEVTLLNLGKKFIKECSNKSNVSFFSIDINDFKHIFIVELLGWDTSFFKKPMYKIHYVLYAHSEYKILKSAVREFISLFTRHTNSNHYCYIDIPSEDIVLIQALTESSFRLVETRIHQFIDLRNKIFERFPVRSAGIDDVSNLSRMAYKMRNSFDRFHADVYFDNVKADEYLAKFAEESVKGFADIVIVPFQKGTPPDAFFAANYLKDEWDNIGEKVSQLVLAAISSETCKGWYVKLLSELCFRVREFGSDYIITNTQTTNRAAIHANEKLTFKYGHTTHILCIS